MCKIIVVMDILITNIRLFLANKNFYSLHKHNNIIYF